MEGLNPQTPATSPFITARRLVEQSASQTSVNNSVESESFGYEPSMREHFVIEINAKAKVRAFAPSLFLQLRTFHQISESDLLESLNPINNRENIFKSNQQTGSAMSSNQGGKSGSFFFFSEDKQYIVKTISTQERTVLLKMLDAMVEHFQ